MVMLQVPQLSAPLPYDTAKHTTVPASHSIRVHSTQARKTEHSLLHLTSCRSTYGEGCYFSTHSSRAHPGQAVGRDDAETLSPFSAVRPHPSHACCKCPPSCGSFGRGGLLVRLARGGHACASPLPAEASDAPRRGAEGRPARQARGGGAWLAWGGGAVLVHAQAHPPTRKPPHWARWRGPQSRGGGAHQLKVAGRRSKAQGPSLDARAREGAEPLLAAQAREAAPLGGGR